MVIQYKCPDCGSDMLFDSHTGGLACQSCGRQMPVEDYRDPILGNSDTLEGFEDFETQTLAGAYDEEDASIYQCGNCGAVLITDNDTVSSSCSFCGAPMVLGDRLEGVLCPAKIIPFSISKSQAQEAFKKWRRGGIFAPKSFKNTDRIKEMTGMYVPFWLFDINARGETFANCCKIRTYEDADYTYTETRHYNVYRKAEINYLKIPADASEKMDDSMMELLEPFDYSGLKEFQIPYLAGYLSEKYNYTDQQLFPRIKERASAYAEQYIRSTIHEYSSVSIRSQWMDIRQKNAYYTLLPVWMICYDHEHKEHTFLMNGQTGKVVGNPPISPGKVAVWYGGIAAVIFLALEILTLLSGGMLS